MSKNLVGVRGTTQETLLQRRQRLQGAPHHWGLLWSCQSPPTTIESCTSSPLGGRRVVRLAAEEVESSEAGLRGEARTGHPPSLLPSSLSSRLHRLPSPHSHFLKESRSSALSTRKQDTAVSFMFPSHRPPSRGIGGAFAQRGRRGARASPSGTLPIVGGLAGMGHRPGR